MDPGADVDSGMIERGISKRAAFPCLFLALAPPYGCSSAPVRSNQLAGAAQSVFPHSFHQSPWRKMAADTAQSTTTNSEGLACSGGPENSQSSTRSRWDDVQVLFHRRPTEQSGVCLAILLPCSPPPLGRPGGRASRLRHWRGAPSSLPLFEGFLQCLARTRTMEALLTRAFYLLIRACGRQANLL